MKLTALIAGRRTGKTSWIAETATGMRLKSAIITRSAAMQRIIQRAYPDLHVLPASDTLYIPENIGAVFVDEFCFISEHNLQRIYQHCTVNNIDLYLVGTPSMYEIPTPAPYWYRLLKEAEHVTLPLPSVELLKDLYGAIPVELFLTEALGLTVEDRKPEKCPTCLGLGQYWMSRVVDCDDCKGTGRKLS